MSLLVQNVLALALFTFGPSCGDGLPPVRATYTPTACPVVRADPAPTVDAPVDQTPQMDQGSTPPPATAKVNLNTATQADLVQLPGVGPALAQRILDYRAKRPFKRISDVRRVKGIGPAKYAKIKELIVVD